jgi:primosomal protein N' (replication factor Y)
LQGRLHIGSRVLVPLGRTSAQGLVFHLTQQAPQGLYDRGIARSQLREIAGLIDSPDDTSLDSTLIRLAGQVTEYYLAPPASGLRLLIPPPLPGQISKRVMLTDSGRQALESPKLSPHQASLLTRLSKSPKGLTLATLRKTIKNVAPLLTRLKQRGLIVEHDRVRSFSTPASKKSAHLVSESHPSTRRDVPPTIKKLSPQTNLLVLVKEEEDQFNTNLQHIEGFATWRRDFLKKLSRKKYDELLVYDAWAVRQRCLVQAVTDTLRAQRAVLVLTPEINQASRIAQSLQDQFGDRIGLYHGDLPQRDRSRLWHAIREGQFDVVVGTRMALFVPLPSLGLVWVEREEDPSYKEEQIPSYHAREVARMRAKLESSLLVLSSAHPSLETVHQFRDYTPNFLAKKTNAVPVPDVRVVNLQQTPYGTMLSDDLINGMQKALGANGSVILFLNRKAFSRALLCKDCGHVPQCSACGVTLPLYKKPARLVCSYCGQTHIPPVRCSSCQSTRLEPSGFGTERLEEIVQQQFPLSKVARFDREVVKTSKEETDLLERFKHGNINILIGTELLFHGPTLPRADFVGIPYADGGLHIPDFRSAERTYRLLEQAMSMADVHNRHSLKAEVVLQTYLPTHHVIQAVVQRDARMFYDQELGFREALGYPPFTHLIQLAISGKHQDRVVLAAKRCRDLLVAGVKKEGVRSIKSNEVHIDGEDLLGPISSLHPRTRGISRYVMVIKSRQFDLSRQQVHAVREELELALRRERMTLEVNVDPLEIL